MMLTISKERLKKVQAKMGKILDELNSEERKCNAYIESRTKEDLRELMEEDEVDEEQDKINAYVESRTEEADRKLDRRMEEDEARANEELEEEIDENDFVETNRWLARRMKIDEDYEKLCDKVFECYTKAGKIIDRMRY